MGHICPLTPQTQSEHLEMTWRKVSQDAPLRFATLRSASGNAVQNGGRPQEEGAPLFHVRLCVLDPFMP